MASRRRIEVWLAVVTVAAMLALAVTRAVAATWPRPRGAGRYTLVAHWLPPNAWRFGRMPWAMEQANIFYSCEQVSYGFVTLVGCRSHYVGPPVSRSRGPWAGPARTLGPAHFGRRPSP